MENSYYVYSYIDPRSGMPFYIGKGKGNRCYQHLKETKYNTENYKKWERINQLKELNIDPEIKLVHKNLSSDEAYRLEDELILKYGRIGKEVDGMLTNVGINRQPPIVPRKPYKHTKESRDKMAKAKLGKPNASKGIKRPHTSGKNNVLHNTNPYKLLEKRVGYVEAQRVKEEAYKKCSEKLKGIPRPDLVKNKIKETKSMVRGNRDKIRINDGSINTFLEKEKPIPDGWVRGWIKKT